MKEARYFYVPDAASVQELPPEEALHAVRVLRLVAGDEIFLMDGCGSFYRAEVTVVSNKHCFYAIRESLPQEKTWRGHIHLAIAPTKMMERMEWMAEKATEIGFDELSFLNCQFSERKVVRTDRIDKIVVAATKQSRKAWKPVVNPLCTFAEFMARPHEGLKFIAHCYEEFPRTDLFDLLKADDTAQPITLLVGPEGDFSAEEVKRALDCGFIGVSLGSSRLRTETAGLAAVMMSHLCRRK
jgi:16S rRNA (uracil1498-N3)-methyltransferase